MSLSPPLLSASGPSGAVRITSGGPQTVYVAEGNNILISCVFELDSGDAGELDIEWAIINPDTTERDVIVSHTVHQILPGHGLEAE